MLFDLPGCQPDPTRVIESLLGIQGQCPSPHFLHPSGLNRHIFANLKLPSAKGEHLRHKRHPVELAVAVQSFQKVSALLRTSVRSPTRSLRSFCSCFRPLQADFLLSAGDA